MYGLQCHLRLWFESFNRDLKVAPDRVTQATMDSGTEVGVLAQKRYRGGRLIDHDHNHFRAAQKETKELLTDSSISTLFEPAFQFKRVQCRVDVLQRIPGGGWRLIEVKSSAEVKDEYVDDAAVQYWILRGCKIDVRDVCILFLNTEYVRGKRLSVKRLFVEQSVWDEVQKRVGSVTGDVDAMKKMLSKPNPPDIPVGDHCTDPYKCPFIDHCWSEVEVPDHSIGEFYRLGKKSSQVLKDRGIEEIRDVPEDIELSDINQVIRNAVRSGRAKGRDGLGLKEKILDLRTPVRHLDFETFFPAIPRFEGTRPYQQIPFMFSMHTESKSGALKHTEYLHEEGTDPRRNVAEKLIKSAGKRGSICMYSHYERTQIKYLAVEYPDLEDELNKVKSRLVDLEPFLRAHYYHPEFRGSYSLKSVLPVLGNSDYSDLEINNGRMASYAYMDALATEDLDYRTGYLRIFGSTVSKIRWQHTKYLRLCVNVLKCNGTVRFSDLPSSRGEHEFEFSRCDPVYP